MARMDPGTTLIIATLMMLLNGGVLGLMHRGLSADVRPSAADWRIGTLLMAGGSVLLAAQAKFQPGFILPLANGCLLLALALYWRAVRRFDGHPDTVWVFAPMLVAALGVYWFAAVMPTLRVRVMVASVAWVFYLSAAAYSLLGSYKAQAAVSRAVLAGLFLAVACCMLLRGLYFGTHPDGAASILDGAYWFNALTPLVAAVLPVIGTTAFLMMSSERIRQQWELAASTDYLTGLPNRRTIHGTGDARFNAAQRAGAGLAVALIDIDHFKPVNDRYGHDVGDAALKHIAGILERHCRGPHLVGRMGGEEFVVLLEVATTKEALAAAERLRRAVEKRPFELGGELLPITVSIGVGLFAPGDTGLASLLRRADTAMYAAKARGRNRVEVQEGGDTVWGAPVSQWPDKPDEPVA